MNREKRRNRIKPEWLLLTGLLALALTARLLPGQRIVDDAYITFRYARNLITGRGFVYNPGEHVFGTTTPLYTCLLAGLALVTGSRDFPALAVGINALSGATAVGLLYVLGKRLAEHQAPALGAALLWAVAPYSVTFAIGGMETDLTIGLLLATAYAHLSGKTRTLAVLSGLALLARPDTAILVGLVWLDQIFAQRRIPWQEGLIASAVLAPWALFGTLYFGSPLTNSMSAKTVAYRLPPEAGFIRLLQHYATPFFEHRLLPSVGVFFVLVLYCALCILGGLNLFKRERRTWPITIYPLAYFATFAAANPLIFRWYLSPPLPFYFLLILIGLWTLLRCVVGSLWRGNANGLRRKAISLMVFAFCTATATTLTLNGWELHPNHGPVRPAPRMAWFQLERLYAQAADVVLSHASPHSTLCAGDIGVLGYRTDLHILDTVGLVTPEVANHYPTDPDIYVINYAIPADLILALDPDFIVILEVYGRLGLLPDPRFQARYQLVTKIEADVYGSDGMLIFGRALASP
jgi:hypothetical protein